MAERTSQGRLPDLPKDSSTGSRKDTVTTDVLYNIRCEDEKNKRIENFRMTENPFEELIVQDIDNGQAPTIIEIQIEAYGTGSPSGWMQISSPATSIGKSGALFGEVKYDMPREGRFRYASSPSRRDTSFPDFGSEDDNDNDDDSFEDERFTSLAKTRTFQESDMTQLPLREILNKRIFKASMVVWEEIHIYSRNLQKLLQSVVQQYPGQSLKGDKIVVKAPFEILALYYNDLNAILDRTSNTSAKNSRELDDNDDLKQPGTHDEVDVLDSATAYDLNVLLCAFRLHYVKNFAPEEAKNRVGVTSYDFLWFLFKPGVDLYARVRGKLVGFVFKSCEIEREKPRNDHIHMSGSISRFCHVKCWHMRYNGRRIVRTVTVFKIGRFRGDKPITSLPIFPSIYLDNEDGGKTRARLQELGEKYYSIARRIPAHMDYCGMGWDLDQTDRRENRQSTSRLTADIEYNGEIVVDYRLSGKYTGVRNRSPDYDYARPIVLNTISSTEEESDPGDDIQAEALLAEETKSTNFRRINPKEVENLTPHHYFLLPRWMNGYALTKKHRMRFDVENIQSIDWPPRESDPMSTLILDDSDKDVIKALARKYSKSEATWGADFVEGKGEGQIFLLHGPPGTGKTYTVECVAKYTRRPLLRLTVADIGTDERQMEDILGEWFQRGADWGAIILIDEADVFLEKRQVKDLQRNSLVSVFLSCMEYYTGMLFLTTNRIGQIDDAFLSRTSVALTYRTLDSGQQRRIWQGFLKKLSEERKDINLTDRAKKFIENLDKDETTRNVPWNGREIRNALQTAIALASFDAEEEACEDGVMPSRILVRDTHFQTVVDRRKEFIAYRKSIRNQDEEARAYTEGSRAPPPKKV